MYVIKVFHGYISKDGQRTREKSPDKLLIFNDRKQSEAFADKIGGRVKKLQKTQVWVFFVEKLLRLFSLSIFNKTITSMAGLFYNCDMLFLK